MLSYQVENLLTEDQWKKALADEFNQTYFQNLCERLSLDQQQAPVYPPRPYLFEALNLCPLNQTKVIILGQDPYHGPGQAHGLSFSVPAGVKWPPSLRNILKEWQADLGHDLPLHGDLSVWAKQGVLLLNTVLSVRHKEAGSHQNWGWEIFTDKIIQLLNEDSAPKVFILWGKAAGAKKNILNLSRHRVLESQHPSPLSAYRGFWGSKPFSRCNTLLQELGREPIDWSL